MPERIVDKSFKYKLKELLTQQYGIKEISAYFEKNKSDWPDIDLKKIKVYYFTGETKDRFFATRKPLEGSLTKRKLRMGLRTREFRRFWSIICCRMAIMRRWLFLLME